MPKPQKPEDVKDEPGAEERFMRGVKRALETPPKQHGGMRIGRAKPKHPAKSEKKA